MKKIIFLLIIHLSILYTQKDMIELSSLISKSKTVLIGAGAGLSTSAGYTSSGERYDKYFKDFKFKYRINDMYSGSFYPFKKVSEYWAFMSRNIYLCRFSPFIKNTFNNLYEIFKDKNYFVLTTNVDHLFQRANFDKNKLFYMQGDMGLIQCKKPCHFKNYENYDLIKSMLKDQGFDFDEKNELIMTDNIKTEISENLIPKCPVCGGEMDFNLRIGNNFVQDRGWYEHQKLYERFLKENENNDILFIELGVGHMTPGIIKYNFWNLMKNNKKGKYVSINLEENRVPDEIKNRSLIITGDIDEIINKVLLLLNQEKNNDL